MKLIKAKTTKRPKGPYWYWTIQPATAAHDSDDLPTINLTDSAVSLGASKYELFWQFKGSPGDQLEFSLYNGEIEIAKVTDEIVKGKSSSLGWKTFQVD